MFYVKEYKSSQGNKVVISAEGVRGAYGVQVHFIWSKTLSTVTWKSLILLSGPQIFLLSQ